jgi:excinuclease ABC subunit A
MSTMPESDAGAISLEGVRQNNLKNISLKIPVGKLVAVSGVSGSGKSSFAVETLCAEGQRRYIETFSPYARQFMERIGRPDVEEVRDIPPAVAIYQGNPVKTSRSTVATMSEIADFIKVLFARASSVVCGSCSREVRREHPQDVVRAVGVALQGAAVLLTFPVKLASGFRPEEVTDLIRSRGFGRIVRGNEIVEVSPKLVGACSGELEVVMDRVKVEEKNVSRLADSVALAMKFGQGRVGVIPVCEETGAMQLSGRLAFSEALHCPYCDIRYPDPDQNFFSYNSPLGACPECKGFGNIIRIDPHKVVPDEGKALRDGAVRPWVSGYSAECFEDLRRFARREGIPLDVPYRDLGEAHRRAIWEGKGSWYGIDGYFKYMEKRTYKMHFRVLLARYRSYLLCPRCGGGRFRPEVLVYRVAGRSIADVYAMTVRGALGLCREVEGTTEEDPATSMLVGEMARRLDYLQRVGLGYLSLERESRTLSGGEVGRLRLASALGASLTNTLYVLDEPTVGLHPSDIDSLLDVLRELKTRGNTVVVVEHDARVLKSADTIVDLGPGPGAGGGRVVYCGPPDAQSAPGDSVTMRYLTGQERIETPGTRRGRDRGHTLKIVGAHLRNLADIDVDIPLGLFVCVTGVSGSGKSTLVEDVLYASMKNVLASKDLHAAGCRKIEGWTHVDEAVFVDQSPPASTPRANPATYTGLIGTIRALMASAPLARRRGYAASMFSFNSSDGRCPLCEGTGYEKIQMQFLSDLYIRCQQCDGRRFKKEVLEVTLDGKNIHDILSMTIDEVFDFLGGRLPGRIHTVEALRSVGLGYLVVGQPFTTLSSGEIQRLKIAGILAERRRKTRRLILMDEPTTGLHPRDVRGFLALVQKLVEGGDSVVVIEHSMDVVKCADWVIDLGPEGGERGGRVVAAGSPEEIVQCPGSRTAPYLEEALAGEVRPRAPRGDLPSSVTEAWTGRGGYDGDASIRIVGARQNNLRGIEASIPLEKITLITGVSGSGKSSLAFDVLFAEGQRRYLDSVSPYVRQYLKQVPHPDVDYVSKLPPTVAIEQRSSRGGARSTVGTLTEVQPFLRLLLARAGTRRCPKCAIPISPQSQESIVDEILGQYGDRKVRILVPIVKGRKGKHADAMRGAAKRGFRLARVDGKVVSLAKIPALDRYREHFIEIVAGELVPRKAGRIAVSGIVGEAVRLGKGVFLLEAGKGEEKILSTLNRCPGCGRGFDELDPRNFSFNSPMGACPVCRGLGAAGVDGEEDFYEAAGPGEGPSCPACAGKRLKEEFLHVFVDGWNIADLGALPIDRAGEVVGSMRFGPREEQIARPVIVEIAARLAFLKKAGVGYLALDRRADTLSAGESQRVKLAASLGSELRGVCYILDEPTIGLHPADSRMLREIFTQLRRRRNSIVVVEHDEETIRAADYCIELGPGGGRQGGEVVAAGPPAEIAANPRCPTGMALSRPMAHPMRGVYRPPGGKLLRIFGAKAHNLKNVDVKIPLGRLVCVTGVSGSGKSSLLEDVIYEGFRRHARGGKARGPGFDRIEGFERVKNVKVVDQNPIGKTPRSTVSTYVGFMSDIRRLFAMTPEARMRGYGPSHFSFNVSGGRCEDCKGQGFRKAKMTFLPLVHVVCETCGGRRYTDETLKVGYRGRSIADVLSMTVSEAREFFSFHRAILPALTILDETGLGYVQLGQSSPTLSGGEAQRIKLAAEMAGVSYAKYSALQVWDQPCSEGVHAEPERERARSARPRRSRATLRDTRKAGTRRTKAAIRPAGAPAVEGGHELAGHCTNDTVYLLEEPTTGLHALDVRKILATFHRLVDGGATVVVIEHHLDVVAEADWIIDLGPGGGEAGGEVVAQGTVAEVVSNPGRSLTARFLKSRLGT